jgi:phosphoglycolate phosphatase
MPARLDLLVLDLDGTLADTAPGIAHAAAWALGSLGLPPPSEAEVRERIGGGGRRLMESLLGEAHRGALGDALTAFTEYYEQHAELRTRLYPGVRATLDELRSAGTRLALATAKSRPATDRVLEGLGIRDAFDRVVTLTEMRVPKPDPGCVLDIMEQLDVRPDRAAMVGDTASDAACAHAAGLPAWIVAYGYGYEAAARAGLADETLERFADVLPLAAAGRSGPRHGDSRHGGADHRHRSDDGRPPN